MASLGLVSSGSTTDGVTYFSWGNWRPFLSHRPLAVVSSPLPPSDPRSLFSVLSKFSHNKINFSRVSPLDGVTRGGRPPAPQWRHCVRKLAESRLSLTHHADKLQPLICRIVVPERKGSGKRGEGKGESVGQKRGKERERVGSFAPKSF